MDSINNNTHQSLQYIDLSYLNLMIDNDIETKRTMLMMLLGEIPADMELVSNAIQSEDWVTIKNVTHKLKSTFAFVGNPTIDQANKSIEATAKSNQDITTAKENLEQINTLLPAVLTEIKAVVASI